MTRAPVARAEASAGDAQVPRERRQARDGPGALPAVRALVHRAAPEKDHRGPRRGVAAGERHDPIGREPCLARHPLEGIRPHMLGQPIEADRVHVNELAVIEPLAHDDTH